MLRFKMAHILVNHADWLPNSDFAKNSDDVINGNISALLAPITEGFPSQRPVTPVTIVTIDSLICVWTKGWTNYHDAGDLRRHHAHDIVTVICIHPRWVSCLKPIDMMDVRIQKTDVSKGVMIISGLTYQGRSLPIATDFGPSPVIVQNSPAAIQSGCRTSSMQIETFSALLALCAGFHWSPVESQQKAQILGTALTFSLNKQLNKQSRHRWYEKKSCSSLYWIWDQ